MIGAGRLLSPAGGLGELLSPAKGRGDFPPSSRTRTPSTVGICRPPAEQVEPEIHFLFTLFISCSARYFIQVQ